MYTKHGGSMKRLIVLSVLFSLSLAANAYVQGCYYGREFVNGELVNTCKKIESKKTAKKPVVKAKQGKLVSEDAAAREAAAAAARRAQQEREAEAARKAQQERDAAALAAIGRVQQIEDEISVVLNNDILFQYGKTDLSKDSKETLDKAVELLNQIPNRSLVIQGHTDSIGSEEFNMTLSEERAKKVYDYMMEQGLEIKNVSYKGLGESKPIADNNTKEGRKANRRVEFRIK